jgi:chaperonin GroEL
VNWQDKLKSDLGKTLKAILDGSNVSSELPWPYDTVELQASIVTTPFVSGESARALLARGIEQGRDAVSSAFGLHGTAVSVSSNFGGQKSQRSGAAIASALSSANPVVQLGLDEVILVTREAAAELGDGTKGTAILFSEMVLGGFAALTDGLLLRDLIHEMDRGVEAVVSQLSKSAWPLSEQDTVAVARTAALGDELSAHFVEEAVRRAGADGVVLLEDSQELNTTINVREGMYFDRGFASPRFITDEPNQLVVLNDVYVLICTQRLTSMSQLLPVLEQVARASKSLLIVAEDVDGEALETLIVNNIRVTLPAVAVKAPGYSARQELLKDIAVVTGGVVTRYATSLDTVGLTQLGFAKRVEISRDSTWIIEGAGKGDLIESRAAGIRRQIEINRNSFEIEKLQERLAKLTGATAVIRVGGASASDREERKYRIIAALHSTRLAIKDGVIPGAGTALWHARRHLEQDSFGRGGKIVSASLALPIETHIRNAGLSVSQTLDQVGNQPSLGFDAETQTVMDLRARGVLDPVTIAIRTLQIAFGRARAVLQTGAWDISKTNAPLMAGPGSHGALGL